MTFSQQVKAELCEPRVERKCCAVAEAYGILLYCHTFSPKLIRIITASDELAQRLPHLFKKAFSVSFDELPEAAKSYIKYIEKATDCHIKYVSVGAGRDEYFEM